MIYLQAKITTLHQRWQNNPPTFINMKALATELDQYYQRGAPLYQSLANMCVAVDGKTTDDIVTEVVTTIC